MTLSVQKLVSFIKAQKEMTKVLFVSKVRKHVLLVSRMDHDNEINQNTGEQNKPNVKTFYNKTKKGVVTVDELCATYVKHKALAFSYILFSNEYGRNKCTNYIQ